MSYQPIPDKTQVRSELIGQRVSHYELVEKIGDGQRGAVFRAKNTTNGREVAVKVMREAAWEREIRAAMTLDFPGVAHIYDFGRMPDGRHWVAMELLDGEGLDWRLHRLGVVPPFEVVKILWEVTAALRAAHERELWHGQLRPSSVFLVNQPEGGFKVKLLDFGVALPEGAKNPSEAGDLQALGVLAFTMLTGKTVVPHPLPSPLAPVIPLVLEELVADLVLAASKLRPKTAAEVMERLEGLRPPPIVAGTPVSDVKPAEPAVVAAAAAAPKKRLNPLLIAAPVVAVLALAVVLLWPSAAPAPVVVPLPAPAPAPVTPVAVQPAVKDDPAPSTPRAPRPPPAAPKPTPSEESLDDRISRLEARVKKKPGNDDEALHMLSKQRLRLGGVIDAAERKDISRQLDLWEQAYLK